MLTKKHYLIIAILIILALATSVMLMPGPLELALMELKDKHFAEARAAYEEQLAKGNLSLDTASHLTDLYLQVGAIDKAIEVMEKFVAAHPNHLEARTKLGVLYQYAQRPDDYVRNLEEINRIKSQPENLVALSSIYNFNGQLDKQSGALQKLITDEKGKNPKYFTDLANIQASKHDYTGAIATLREMQKAIPDQFAFENEALLVSLLLDNKQYEEGAKTAGAWVEAHNDLDQSAELVNILHYHGNVALGNSLMSRFNDKQIDGSPALLDAYILLALSDGKEDDAYARLKKLNDAGKLPSTLKPRLLFLAASHGDRELTHTLIKSIELTSLSETQLLTLVELAQTQDDPTLLAYITNAFPESTSAKTYPVLTAAIAVSNKKQDASVLLSRLDTVSLENEQALQMANICSRAKNYNCANHFLDKLPAIDKLSDADVANVGSLYFNMHQFDKGYAYLHQALETRKSILIETVAIQFAAARGNDKEVKDWLAANPDAVNPRLLTDLYFAALDNKHLTTALSVAVIFHDKYNTALSRSLLANAYIKTGQYQLALNLLRENSPQSEEDQNNYFTALVKLAPHNAEYRNELRVYAAAKLRSGASGNQKLAIIYGLVAAGQVDIAMPYIHELALKSGGEWARLYAELLDKEGKHDEARAFWLQVANQPSTSKKTKKEIAYTLLDHGYKADAEQLFMQAAANSPADSTDVKDVLYIMGPRPSAEEMQWLEMRYTEANVNEKSQWAVLIDDTASSDYMAGFVSRHPETMSNPKIANDYFETMLAEGKLASMEKGYIDYTRKSGNTTILREYAGVAESGGLKKEARLAYETIYSVDPTDYIALRQAGVLAYEQADYPASTNYLGKYIAQYHKQPIADPDAYLAYFYYGEIERRNNQPEQAKSYYHTAVVLMSDKPPQTAEAMSIKAQSQVWSGDEKGGMQTFEYARKTYPNNDQLRADQVSVLVDLGHYDEARKVLGNGPHAATANMVATASLPVFSERIKSYTLLDNNKALLIQFAEPIKSTTAARVNSIAWVNYTSEGYDSLLIVAKTGYIFQTVTGAPKSTMSIADNDLSTIQVVADNSTASSKEASQTALRYALLNARIDLETGHIYAATKRLNNLMPMYKNDPQFLGFTGNAENYGGNWPEAEILLKKALAIAPENADLIALNRDMRRENSPNVTLDFEWVDYDKSFENITTLRGLVNATNNIIVGAELQDNYEIGKDLRLSNGFVGDSNGNRERGEIYAMYHTTNGIRVQGSIFGNDDTAGAGGYFAFLNPLGETLLSAEYHKPYWDLPEAVLDDANRDRLSFLHTIKPTTRLTIDGGLGVNRYNVQDIDDVTTSISAQLGVVYRILEGEEAVRPTVNLGYGLDGEYVRTDKESLDDTGSVTRDFPLISREIHSIYADTGYEFSDRTYGDILVGYEVDRLGGNGPLIEGKINHEFTDAFDVQFRASYGLDTTNTQGTITRVGAYARWRF